MRVLSVATEPTIQSMKHENTNGYDQTEFGLINHRRRLIYFNVWLGRNDGAQIVYEDILRYWVAMQKPKWNTVEIEKISLSGSFSHI